MFRWMFFLFFLLLSSCSQESELKDFQKVELQLKEAFFIVKRQEGKGTFFELALPKQLPWPSMDAYEDREYSLPMGYEIVGRVVPNDRLTVGRVLKKRGLFSEEKIQWYSQLATSQGKQWVRIDSLMGAWVHPHIFHSKHLPIQNHYVKVLK